MKDRGAKSREFPVFSCSFFAGLSNGEIEHILSAGTALDTAKGEWIYRQGEPATHFYLLEQGRANLHHLTPDGNDVLLWIMVPLEIFGYRCIKPRATQLTSVQAALDSRCLRWTGAVMRELFLRHPQLALNAFQIVAGHMFRFEIRYGELATEPLEKRMARILLDLARRFGRAEGGAVVLDGGVQQKDISQMTGASIFSVSRIFAAWRRRGIVRSTRGRIVLQDLAAIKRITGHASERLLVG